MMNTPSPSVLFLKDVKNSKLNKQSTNIMKKTIESRRYAVLFLENKLIKIIGKI